jgi:hypothetical protein
MECHKLIMRRFLFILLMCIATVARSQSSGQQITATVTFSAVPSNGCGFSINGQLRYFTNSVFNPLTQILGTNSIMGAVSNLFLAYASYPAPQTTMIWQNANNMPTNVIEFIGYPGYPMNVTNAGSANENYFTVAYYTNTITNAMVARLPISAIGAYEKTNLETGLIGALNDYGSNRFFYGSFSTTNYIGTNGYCYYVTNVAWPSIPFLAFTNPNPGVASTYFVTVSIEQTSHTNPIQAWFYQVARFIVTNSSLTTGCAVTNAEFTNAGPGIPSSTFPITSPVGSSGFGLSIPSQTTNTLSSLAKIEVFTP